MKKVAADSTGTARAFIKSRGGIFRTSEALKAKIHPRTLYQLRDAGEIEEISRGLYKLSEVDISQPDFVTVALKIPEGVICLVSALAFHGITTQIPHKVFVAVKQGARTSSIDFPPLSVHHFSPDGYIAGIETHKIDKVQVKIYSVEKTLVDCFKFRNKIGMDVFLEALKFYKSRKKIRVKQILDFAKTCKVETVMRPYIETLI
ncbi:MAG TPA: type IV toxin-antitoxin system AbiEi family antitoxin domain-containing protein [Ohtaekwangia sp.]|uniref:type IV toxin-antitoxin system AbiEi family antitoxin domain-containing protein n=1 Tax=Ohtaekwangia sp. TaxID=2066019 RepID=UPI002F959771